ncbi:PQQ-dependent sugar dehydrogenase [Solirubrobacter sp. CPCC 204708]|uniref:PQQ-dependent sugar dehydrogenase n=1 Tax=Solirubrobacter deserti TaxID=2282478 RepID=A0ABT4RLE9_9ACTN|nr:RICIN domain-containing protein [Solirubrobacter deserti]MBE2320425.1 PQQ-dependent sugar dehydrogenase [Solirubrobacter deserti]MDA0139384.1 PQQ-dependent sugar dehydrogenase [Solirubrobacter deserti]
MRRLTGLVLLALLAFAAPAAAAPSLVTLGTFAQPTYATGARDDPRRVYVTERAGVVRVLVDGAVRTTPFLDLTSITLSTASERGLLSIAFARDYATSGRFYVYLTATAAAGTSGQGGDVQVREYRRSATDPDAADPASGRVLLSIPHAQASNHNGGQVEVGPDGKLWIATGDGGGGNNQYGHAQNPNSLLGKLIRFEPGGSPEILGRGLRNPWRFSFAPSGEIVIADVGQSRVEEVNVGVAGNYGWPCFEGSLPHLSDSGCNGASTKMPALEKTRGQGYCAITGGYVVRDPGLPTLRGRYLYGDFCASGLRSVDLSNPATDAPVGLSVSSLSSFGEDACGRILAVSLAGPVYRIVDGTATPCEAEPPLPTGWQTLTFVHSGQAMNVNGASSTPGAKIIQWPYAPEHVNSQWQFVHRGTQGFEIVNRLSGQCLDIWSESPGGLLQWPCDGGLGQRWEFHSVAADGSYSIIENVSSGLVINQSGATTAWGGDVIQWPQTPGALNERLVITPVQREDV